MMIFCTIFSMYDNSLLLFNFCTIFSVITYQPKRKALTAGLMSGAGEQKAPVAPIVTVRKPTMTLSQTAAAQGLSGVTSHYVS